MRKVVWIFFAAAVWLAGTSAQAQQPEDQRWCRNGIFDRDQGAFVLGRLVGPGRVYFQDDSDGCPNDETRCLEKGYVEPGDRLIVGRSHEKFICALHPGDHGDWAGWIPRDRVRLDPASKPLPPNAWAGRWKNDSDWLQLSVSGHRLRAHGKAYWPAKNVEPFHLGRFDGTALVHSGPITMRDGNDSNSPGDCIITMRRMGPWLLVSDNQMCGALNVSFSGVYHR